MPTRFTITDLVAQANSTLADNNTQQISPEDVRLMFDNFLSTMKPAFASIRITTPLVIALNTLTPVKIAPWNTVVAASPPELVGSLPAGSVLKQVTTLGNTVASDLITFYIGVQGPSGNDLTFAVFANNIQTDIIVRVSTTGAGNIITAVLTGLLTRTADTVYDVRVLTSNNNSYTFSNGVFRVENIPVA